MRKLFLVSKIFLFLLLAVSPTWAQIETSTHSYLANPSTYSQHLFPRTDGNLMIWQSVLNKITDNQSDIYVYDFKLGQTFNVTKTPGALERFADVSGNLIVYATATIPPRKLYVCVYNAGSCTTVPIYNDVTMWSSVKGNKIVWPGAGKLLYCEFDVNTLSCGNHKTLKTGPTVNGFMQPQILDNQKAVVWTETVSNKSRIVGIRFDTLEEFVVVEDPTKSIVLSSTSGNRLVFRTGLVDPTGSDIYTCKLNDNSQCGPIDFVASDGATIQTGVKIVGAQDISGDDIVFTKVVGQDVLGVNNYEIFHYNAITKTTTQLTHTAASTTHHFGDISIWNKRVAFFQGKDVADGYIGYLNFDYKGAYPYGQTSSTTKNNCGGAIGLTTSAPVLPGGNIKATIVNGPPNAMGVAMFSLDIDFFGHPLVPGIISYMNENYLVNPFPKIRTDAWGKASIDVRVPAMFAGGANSMQVLFQNTPSCGGSGSFSASNALSIQLN